MGYLGGFRVTLAARWGARQRGHHAVPEGEGAQAEPRSTAVTSSTATRTAWRSASAASSAPVSAPPAASTSAAPTTRPTTRSRPGERYGFVYEINYLRCIHCDLCVEACPTEAITESKLFEFSFTNRADAIYTKDELLVDDDGMPQQLPWEDWRPAARTCHTSAWMRATAPSGDAGFEGVVGWSGELGYGVRPPRPARRRSPRRLDGTADAEPTAGRPRRPRPRRRHGGITDRRVRRLRRLRGHRARRRPRRRALAQPGALRAEPGGHAVRRRRALPGPGRPAPRRGAGHRLRRRHRRAVPVRDHAARRRPAEDVSRPSPCVGQRTVGRAGRRGPRRAAVLAVLIIGGDRRRHRRAGSVTPGPRVRHRQRRASSAGSLFTDYVFAFEITAGAAHRRRRRRGRARPPRRSDVQPVPEPESDRRDHG